MKRYFDECGSIVFVSPGICPGDAWLTVRQQKPGAGTQRVNAGALPIRSSIDSAQADLDAYAHEMGWQAVC